MNMITQVDTAERKLKRVKINLMRDDRFAYWRGIMMVGKTELIEDFPTAYTDGYNEGYGRAFVEGQNEKQLAFGVLHENLHKIGRDLSTWRKLFEEDKQLANMACDYRINLLLVDMDPIGMTLEFPTHPDGSRMGLLDERFRNMDVPTIFRILRQEKQDGTGAFAQGGDGANGQGNFDEHDLDASDERTPEERETQAKEIDQAMRQGEMEHRKVNGNKNGSMERFLSEMLQPKINWKDALAEFVRSACAGKDTSTWRRPNRRYLGMDIIMPSLMSERVGHIAVGPDMSGSVTGRQVNLMLTELLQLAKEVRPDKIDLLYWDSDVARHEEYDESNIDLIATSTKPSGGGGTSPACVKRYLKDKRIEPECVIMLTDGYVDSWPDFDCPVLWVITTKGITAPNGVSIHLEDDGQ
jgi:predicted metal-dependent peptidase